MTETTGGAAGAGRPRPDALLLDLDGVLRRFDPEVPAAAERRHGLRPGAVSGVALRPDLLRPAVTGGTTRAGWLAAVADVLGAEIGRDAARAVVAEWDAHRGEVVPEVLGLVRAVRRAGRPVALCSNATDGLPAELAALGLAGEFDAVVNSSVVGVCKPAPGYFEAACRAVATPPERCLFVDDDDRNVRGARAAGLPAYRYTGVTDLRYLAAVLASPAA